MQERVVFGVERPPWDFDLHMRMWQVDEHGKPLYAAQPVLFEAKEPGTRFPPTVILDTNAARSLMDELWRLGVRPSEDIMPTASAFEAQRRHLEDMRQIAFRGLDIR